MDWGELEPRKIAASSRVLGADLSLLGVVELQVYVAELKAEIERVEAEILKKTDVRSQAEAFFK